jgi:hypothetical protein
MAILVDRPSCAAAFPNLPSPVIAVGGNRKHKRDRGRHHHSAQHSDKKYAYHFPHKLTSVRLVPLLGIRQILPCHLGAVPCSLFCTSAPPHFPYSIIESRLRADSLLGRY